MPFVAQTAVDLVKQATVRLISGKVTGTGFFIARNIVLTCAHVLSVPSGGKVLVRVGDRELPGKVLLRLPEKGGRGSYPFPDLAFVGVEQGIDSPTVDVGSLRLRRGTGAGVVLYAYGFNKHTPEPQPVLDAVRLVVVERSERYVKVTPDNAIVDGMSGAPVVDPENGAVVGVVKNHRGEQRAAWYIDGLDVRKAQADNRRRIGHHQPDKPRLYRPEPGHPLHGMLVAQGRVAEELPYQVVQGDVPLSTIYVEQRTEAWRAELARATAGYGNAPPEPTPISPYEMLARHRNALVVGGPGGGKSTMLQHLVLESVEWWRKPEPAERGEEPPFGPAIAIRCPAARLLTGTAWADAVADAVNAELAGFQHTALTSETFSAPPMEGVEWLILIDGLDEVLDPRKRAKLIAILAARVSEYGSQARFVVTSRRLVEGEFQQLRSTLLRGQRADRLGEYNLRPFDRPAVELFAKKWFDLRDPGRTNERQAGFLASIDNSHLMPLVSIPLLCTIAADVYQQSPDAPLPIGRTGLYERFVDGLLYTRRVQRDARSTLREQLEPISRAAEDFGETLFEKRLDCVTHLAELRLKEDRQPSVALVREWLAANGIEVPRGVTDENIREMLLSTGLVVNRGDSLEFTHQSIAEFLASGPAAERFNEEIWLYDVDARGANSVAMFTLDRWAAAGNDTTGVVTALATPGRNREYPRLPDLAAVVEDGAALAGTRADTVIDLTIRAVEDIPARTRRSLPAINRAARAVLQRAPDAAPLIRLAHDRRERAPKRIEVAKVLYTDGDAEAREQGLAVLIGLAYEHRTKAVDRLSALRALAELGTPAERGHAIQHIAQLVERGRAADTRAEAFRILIGLGVPGEAVFASVRRLVAPDLPVEERAALAGELAAFDRDAFVGDDDEESVWFGPDELPPGQVWSRPGRRPRSAEIAGQYSDAVGLLSEAIYVVSAFDPDRASRAFAALMHDRVMSWGERTKIAWRFSDGRTAQLARLGLDELVSDPAAPPVSRVALRWLHRQRTDPAGAEAILRGIAGDDGESMVERSLALEVMMARGDRESAVPFIADLSRDPGYPPRLRIEAAVILGRHPTWYPLAEELLAGIVADRALPRRWRWLARFAVTAAAIDPATRYLCGNRRSRVGRSFGSRTRASW
jgi:Trypsin-like peptidase domain